jgi:hypothetical protein
MFQVIGDILYADGMPFADIRPADVAKGQSHTDRDYTIRVLNSGLKQQFAVCPECGMEHDDHDE